MTNIKKDKDPQILQNIADKRWRRRLHSKAKAKHRRKHGNKPSSGVYIDDEHFDREKQAPSNFSFGGNREGVLIFITKLENNLYKEKSVFVNLKYVISIDLEAIVLLLGIMAEYNTKNIRFNGYLPDDESSKQKLVDSGFLNQLFPTGEKYNFGSERGIYTHGTNVFDQELSYDIVSNSLVAVFGEKRRSQGSQKLLIEAMKNTISHAGAGTDNRRHWWLSVKKDAHNKKATFTFLDYGVGIFKSLSTKGEHDPGYTWLEKNTQLGVKNHKILKKIMSGELQHVTRSKKHKQGNGLPGMKSALDNNYISKLTILSNDVLADIGQDSYEQLKTQFSGTMIQFDIINTCKSFEE